MKKKCFVAFAAALLAAAMALFLLCGCSSGGDDGQGGIPQGPGANQGGEQKPGEGENQGGEGGNSGDEGNEDEAVLYKDLKDFFEKNYEDEFKGVTQSTNITLTAQTIKDVVEKTPAFESQVKAANTKELKAKAIQDFKTIDDNSKIAIMAQVAGNLTIENKGSSVFDRREFSNNSYGSDSFTYSNKYLISAKDKITISLSGVFNYAEMDIKFAEKINKNLKNAEFNLKKDSKIWALYSSKFEEICSDLGINDIKEEAYLPILNFALYIKDNGLKHFLGIYEKYNESGKMQITGNFSSTPFDGSKLVDNSSNYTLFSSDNIAKTSGTESVKSININTLVNFSKKYNTKEIKNIIVSGIPSANSSVAWTNLTNVIFEGNMSNLTINNKTYLKGIVYFKDLPYNNISSVIGSLKLDKMANTMDGDGQKSFVLDVSGISNFYSYLGNPLIKGSRIVNAVYFNKDQKSKKSDTLYQKVADAQSGVIDNVYFVWNIRGRCKL